MLGARTLLLGIAMAFAADAAYSDAVVYDFTGVVTESNPLSPMYANVGDPVIGSFTINYANAKTLAGTIGSSSWAASESDGLSTVIPTAPLLPPVFSMTLQAGSSFFYSTAAPDAVSHLNSAVSGANGSLSANEYWNPPDSVVGHYFNFSNLLLNGYNAQGLPVADSMGSGYAEKDILGSSSDLVAFNIDTVHKVGMTSAPEIGVSAAASTLALLGSLLALFSRGFGAFGRSKP